MHDLILLSTGTQISIKLGIWIAQVIVGLLIAIGSLYLSMRLLSRLIKGVDQEAEVARGNRAIGVLSLGVSISISLVTSSGIVGLTDAVTNVSKNAGAAEYGRAIIFGVIQLLVSLLLAVIAVVLAFRVWDKLTPQIPAVKKLQEDNLAVGIMWAGVLIAVGIILREAVSGLGTIISSVG